MTRHPQVLVADLVARGITLSLSDDGERLVAEGPLTDEDVAELRRCKQDLIRELSVGSKPVLTGQALTDAVLAKLAAVPDVIREEVNDLLWWAGEPNRAADQFRRAGLPDDFDGVCRWVLTASPLEIPRALMRANAYPDKYRFASDYKGENDA
jgi:hypothetical protein